MKSTLSHKLYAPEASCVEDMLKGLSWSAARSQSVYESAAALTEKVRGRKRKAGELESFLQHYALSTQEGLALMCLAEALLRVPDSKTANDLIRDKIAAADWLKGLGDTKDWLVKASGVGLSLCSFTLDSLLSRLGEPVIREAMAQAIRIMGGQFVLGRTIDEAIKRSQDYPLYRMSYDMLGEGARTAEDAEKYFNNYAAAIEAIGKSADPKSNARRPGISVKLSALYPRYEVAQAHRCVPALKEKVKILAQAAAAHNLSFTVDAEETERLELSLQIIEALLSDPDFPNWPDFGLAIQAYQKRCFALIDRLSDLARTHKRRLQVRLVKGAYWDGEIKKAQVKSTPDYPVFTRKVNTDLSYLACAEKMLKNGDVFYPMFATHNAYTAAAILDIARDYPATDFEFQRLHGMGEAVYDILLEQKPDIKVSVYAPVGPHSDLLAYLVRRLLENGANSSFVNKVMDDRIALPDLLIDPVENARQHSTKTHGKIPLPAHIYNDRKNSSGIDLNDEPTLSALITKIQSFKNKIYLAAPLVSGTLRKDGIKQDILSPADRTHKVGTVYTASHKTIELAFETAQDGFEKWSSTPADIRATALEKFADLLEFHHAELMALCVYEAGKTIKDAHLEIREAVDFCRYYAQQGRKNFHEKGSNLPGPSGESNILHDIGRGMFVCISPWNFPLAIFTGQITAALMAGNAVIAKPAEQTPLIAFRTVQLLHEAGIPANILHLLPGDGAVGAHMIAHKDVAGVAFTGSTEVAKIIQRSLAAKNGPIVPLIAETGGQNAMIVDSSALPEQVVDDVILSAFGSTGQRCSALRVLFLQNDIADKILHMLSGAMAELVIGHPEKIATDIGPVIDMEALSILNRHHQALDGFGKKIAQTPLDERLTETGNYFAPCAYEIPALDTLSREVFGPVLHVIRFKASGIDEVIADINKTGYGLTLGVHSRIESFQKKIAQSIRAGNMYVNRSMIGAVVGTQPFGGMGLSGTGPKAGGPHYLKAFSTEKVITIDTTSAGGNTSLVSLEE
jgi:RHH-type proline utilization regulon transcriptional repressor/proline dehydrogenase/delta 1-pyrroline-5-carboxylate dehydrogenase